MHVTILRHTRAIVQQIYSSLSPSQRVKFDASLRIQKFPHFFMYYEDHEIYFDKLQNLVLHLHLHFDQLFNNHGSCVCVDMDMDMSVDMINWAHTLTLTLVLRNYLFEKVIKIISIELYVGVSCSFKQHIKNNASDGPTGSTTQYFRTIAKGIYGGSTTAIDTKKRKTKEEKFRKQFRLTKYQNIYDTADVRAEMAISRMLEKETNVITVPPHLPICISILSKS
ncbi:unnamed protein product [Adineta steineri]|uniref:Uncharacterized protein n=1 Tax=Adineta steineri TaxID=433720 RepID=A0A819W1I5_9BILA|nr:unnamed protein product [Adineta steineri]